jgi:hypothetical protein
MLSVNCDAKVLLIFEISNIFAGKNEYFLQKGAFRG